MAITSAFQADDAGSIPAARSNLSLILLVFEYPDASCLAATISLFWRQC